MKVLISAAEASSDAHAAKLLESLRGLLLEKGQTLEAFGVGGPKLQAAGLRVLVDARELLSMGFTEILSRLPRILKSLRRVAEEAERVKPEIAVVVDYPDFHFRLARKLKRAGIPVVYYIPPKVWVWRSGRVRAMRELFSKVLCIFPFEEESFKRLGLEVKFVGNPLVEELPMGVTQADARKQLGIGAQELRDYTVLVMPGSRPSELSEHLDLMLEACAESAAQMKKGLLVLCPFPSTVRMSELEPRLKKWKESVAIKANIRVRFSQGDAALCMAAADAGLVKSGTSTLEAGLMSLPHAVVYRPSKSTELIFKYLIRYRGPVGLVNLVADERGPKARAPFLCREILMDQATVANLSAECTRLLSDSNARVQLKQGFDRLRKTLKVEASEPSPSRRAAEEIWRIAGRS